MAAFTVQGLISLATDAAEKALSQIAEQGKQSASGVEKDFSKASTQISNQFEKLGKVIKSALSIGAIVQFGKSLYALAKQTAAYGDNVDKASQKLGISRKAYQEWSYILSQNGADVSSLTTAMRTLTSTMSNGSNKTKQALKTIGLSFEQLKGMSQQDQFMSIVKGLAGMENQAERNALAATLFGRSYQQLLPLLNSGAESIEQLQQKAHDLGIVMDDEAIDAAVNFTDNLDNLNRSWSAFKMSFGAQMLKPLTRAFETITGWISRLIPTVRDAFKTGDWSGFFGELTDILAQALPTVVDTLINVVVGILDNADKIADLAGTLINGLIRGLSIAVPKLVQALPTVVSSLWNSLKQSLPDALQSVFSGIWTTIAGLLGISETDQASINQIFTGAFSGISAIVSQVTGAFNGVWTTIIGYVNDPTYTTGEKVKGIFNAVFFGQEGQGGIVAVYNAVSAFFDNLLYDVAKSIGLGDVYLSITAFFNKNLLAPAKTVFDSVVNAWSGLFTEIEKLFNGDQSIGQFISNVFGGVNEDGSKSGLFGVADAVAQTFSGFVGAVLEACGFDGQPVEALTKGFSDAFSGVTELFAGISEVVGGIVDLIMQIITGDFPDSDQSVWDRIFGGLKDAAQGVFDIINGIVNAIAALMGVKANPGDVDAGEVIQGKIQDFINDPVGSFVQAMTGEPLIRQVDYSDAWMVNNNTADGATQLRVHDMLVNNGLDPNTPVIVPTEVDAQQLHEMAQEAATEGGPINMQVIPEFTGEGGGLKGFPGYNGHATGLDYVPFDNYVGQLHRGEAVLSAFEAAEWRSRGQLSAGGNNSTYTDNNTLYVGQMYMSNDMDAEQLQLTLAELARKRNRGYGL